jgi:hypothetical protein
MRLFEYFVLMRVSYLIILILFLKFQNAKLRSIIIPVNRRITVSYTIFTDLYYGAVNDKHGLLIFIPFWGADSARLKKKGRSFQRPFHFRFTCL